LGLYLKKRTWFGRSVTIDDYWVTQELFVVGDQRTDEPFA